MYKELTTLLGKANRFIITGDIHLDLTKNTEFELNRFKEYINLLDKEAGVIVFAGDLFNRAKPTLIEIKAFYEAINLLSINHKIVIIDGNHEKVDKYTTTFDYLPRDKFIYLTAPTVYKYNKVNLWFVGHSHLKDVNTIELLEGKNLLVSHFRCSLGVIKQEVNVNQISKDFDYVIVGDIHQHYKPFNNVEYTSQPYNTHYDTQKDNGYIVLDLKPRTYKVTYKKVNLPNKYKLELTAKEYLDLFHSFSKDNLYKITIKDRVDNVKNLSKRDNVLLSFSPTINIDEGQLDTIKDELRESGNIDVVTTMKRLIRESEELNETTLRKGEELVEHIVKGYL